MDITVNNFLKSFQRIQERENDDLTQYPITNGSNLNDLKRYVSKVRADFQAGTFNSEANAEPKVENASALDWIISPSSAVSLGILVGIVIVFKTAFEKVVS